MGGRVINNVRSQFVLIFNFNSQEEQHSVSLDIFSKFIEIIFIPQNNLEKQESPIDHMDFLAILHVK